MPALPYDASALWLRRWVQGDCHKTCLERGVLEGHQDEYLDGRRSGWQPQCHGPLQQKDMHALAPFPRVDASVMLSLVLVKGRVLKGICGCLILPLGTMPEGISTPHPQPHLTPWIDDWQIVVPVNGEFVTASGFDNGQSHRQYACRDHPHGLASRESNLQRCCAPLFTAG